MLNISFCLSKVTKKTLSIHTYAKVLLRKSIELTRKLMFIYAFFVVRHVGHIIRLLLTNSLLICT